MTQNNKYIPEGYKDSPLGVIPQEWEVKRLGDICKTFSGGTPKSTESRFYDGNIPFIKSGEINDNRTEQFLSDDGYKKSSAKMVAQGDILYALYGANSGECAISQIHGAINQAILCIRTNIDSYFLLSVLQKNKDFYIRNYLQGGQGNLSGEIVKSYSIAVPPLAEQRRIAEVLNCWDVAIEKQNALAKALTRRKRALMQQLLTGKKRLPGFTGEWEKVRLGEVAKIGKNGSLSKSDVVVNGKYKCLLYGELFTRYNAVVNKIHSHTNTIEPNVAKFGDILMPTSDVTPEGLGKACCILCDNVSLGGDINVIRPNTKYTYSIFLSYLINYNKNKTLRLISGTTIKHIYKSDIIKLTLNIPSLNEQKAIAEVLSKADREIEIVENKLIALRTQKQALMQQLLTGKKRLKLL